MVSNYSYMESAASLRLVTMVTMVSNYSCMESAASLDWLLWLLWLVTIVAWSRLRV